MIDQGLKHTGLAQNAAEKPVLEQLRRAVPITARRMFGCIGVYSGDTFFAIVDDACLYFKVDAEDRFAYEARGMKPFAPDGRRIASFYQVPPEILTEQDVFRRWATAAVAAANRKNGR